MGRNERTESASTTSSVWSAQPVESVTPRLRGEHHTDVLVVGAGITGLTTALLLARQGRSVLVVDAARFGVHGTSHRTSAHLTSHPDEELTRLERTFGRDALLRTSIALRGAIDLIERFDAELGAQCDFRRVDAWRYSEENSDESRESLQADAKLAKALGAECDLHDAAPLPFPTKLACRFGRQAAFHPLRYLSALATEIARQPGCAVHEDTRVVEYDDGEPCRVKTEDASITCRELVLATHSPIGMWTTLHTRLVPMRSSCIVVETEREAPDGLFWDTADPYHYTRRVDSANATVLLVGGEDRKTGSDEEPEARFEALSRFVGERFGRHRVLSRWSAELFESADGLPYSGRGPGCDHVHVATGYDGVGLTFGTASAALICDLISGVDNPWEQDVSPSRVKALATAGTALDVLATSTKAMVTERLRLLVNDGVDDLPRGEGRVVRIGAEAVAAHRDIDGELHLRSAVCPHMGCLVAWNSAEQQWDCPCHGSIFRADGEVVSGPATTPLAEVTEAAEAAAESKM